MRLLLSLARQKTNQDLIAKKKIPAKLIGTTEQVFNLGTIKGARAVNMGEQTGSITEGKLADVVIFDGLCGGPRPSRGSRAAFDDP